MIFEKLFEEDDLSHQKYKSDCTVVSIASLETDENIMIRLKKLGIEKSSMRAENFFVKKAESLFFTAHRIVYIC